MAKGVWLEDLTWPEAKAWIDRDAPFILPIGAASKEHGAHLPLKTDWLLARDLSRRVIAELPVVAAPVVGFGYYPAFVNYPGSQHIDADLFYRLLKTLLSKLMDDGVKNLAVINTGVSTEPTVRLVSRDLYQERGIRVHTADIRFLGKRSEAGMQQKLGGHGDESETSMILAIEPGSVRMDRAVVDYGHALDQPKTVFYVPTIFNGDPASGPDYSVMGVRGDPTLATAEKGEAILSEMARELVDGLKTLFPEALKNG